VCLLFCDGAVPMDYPGITNGAPALVKRWPHARDVGRERSPAQHGVDY
jgi:hypothetical protein